MLRTIVGAECAVASTVNDLILDADLELTIQQRQWWSHLRRIEISLHCLGINEIPTVRA